MMSAFYTTGALLSALLVIMMIMTPAALDSRSFAGQPAGVYLVEDRKDRERLGELKRAVDAEVGEPRADDLAQCRFIAFGAKPCGGPWRYLVYSTGRTDEPKLKRLVAEYNVIEKKINAEENLSSDCDRAPQPQLVIENGVCAARRE